MSKQKIVVLGGSFNPPTVAHQQLLSTAMHTLQADMGLFVPSSDAYVTRKMSRQKDPMVFSEENRVKMLEMLCKSKMSVDASELGDDGRGHTYDTLVKIQKKYPNAEIIFLIGADKLHILPKWHNRDSLLKQFYFGIATRNENGCEGAIKNTIKYTPKLAAYADHFTVIPTTDDMSDISSTKARQYIAQKQWRDVADIVSSNVASFICFSTMS